MDDLDDLLALLPELIGERLLTFTLYAFQIEVKRLLTALFLLNRH